MQKEFTNAMIGIPTKILDVSLEPATALEGWKEANYHILLKRH